MIFLISGTNFSNDDNIDDLIIADCVMAESITEPQTSHGKKCTHDALVNILFVWVISL